MSARIVFIPEPTPRYTLSRPGPIGFIIIFTILIAFTVILIVLFALSSLVVQEPPTIHDGFVYIPSNNFPDYGVIDLYAVNTGQDTPENPCFPGAVQTGPNLKSGVFDSDNIFLCQEKGYASVGLVDYVAITGTNPNITCPDGYIKNEVNLNSNVTTTNVWNYLCRKYGESPYIQDVQPVAITNTNPNFGCPSYGYFDFGQINVNTGTTGNLVRLCGQKFYENVSPNQ